MEFRIAAVGPATSLVLGAGFTVMAWALSGAQAPELISGAAGGCADGRALVMDEGRLVGIISSSDVSRAAALRGIGVQSFDGAGLARSTGPWR